MPKSKRAREVALTKTDKRSTRSHKTALIQKVREAVEKYDSIYVLHFENMRSSKFKNIRRGFKDDRIFLGKNKLLQIALGRTLEEEYSDNLHHISKLIVGGSVGLLCTSQSSENVEAYFQNTKEDDFARAGSKANKDVMVTNTMLKQFPTSMMEPFRKLGLSVEIQNGVVVLRDGQDEQQICYEGEILTAEKCRLLQHFGIQLSTFHVSLAARWSDGEFEPLMMM